MRYAFQGEKCNRLILRVEKSVERGPTGLHPASQRALGDIAFCHFLLNLVCDDPLDGSRLGFFKKTFFLKKVVESASDMVILFYEIAS